MEQYFCKTKLFAGNGAVSALGQVPTKRLLVVTDPYFAQNGTARRIAGEAKAEAVEFFDKVRPDPSVELVAQGTEVMTRFQPDTVIALGGGSAMDCAKAMAYFAPQRPYFVAIPTTSGSGSEVTDFAILTYQGVKHPLVDEKLQPDMAILEESLVQALPPQLVAEGGFDCISHALEAWVATNAGAVTDALAQSAFTTAIGLLPASFAGAVDVRLAVHKASCLSAMAFNRAGLGLCHAISHALGGMFHIPHGRLNAILLPAVLECNAHAAAPKYAKLARLAGLGGSADTLAVRNLKQALIGLRKQLHLPATLCQAGLEARQVQNKMPQIAKAALADPCCATNPMAVEEFMVYQILEAVTGRG